jgi:hypothetical protein
LNRLGDMPRAVVAIHAANLQVRHGGTLSQAGSFVEFRAGRLAEGVGFVPKFTIF